MSTQEPNPSLSSYAEQILAAAGRRPRMPIEFTAQCGEDALILACLDGQVDGFYIEVGAFDGKTFSTTYALDAMGWNGLLIEAIPERYAECVKNRPHARVVHAALGPPGQKPTTKFNVTTDQWGGMLSSVGKGVSTAGGVQAVREVEVPFTTMDELLKEHKGEIDVASIDVEGFEVPLLQGFNLKKHRPKLLIIEDEVKGETAISRYMKSQPYTQIGVRVHNRVYARRDLANLFHQRIQE